MVSIRDCDSASIYPLDAAVPCEHMAPEDRGKDHCTMCFNIEFSCRNCLACSQRLVGFNLG